MDEHVRRHDGVKAMTDVFPENPGGLPSFIVSGLGTPNLQLTGLRETAGGGWTEGVLNQILPEAGAAALTTAQYFSRLILRGNDFLFLVMDIRSPNFGGQLHEYC